VTEKGRSVEKFRSLRIEQRLLEPEKTGSSRKCVPYIRGEEDHGISAA
jgi:hypothetical protein